MKKQIHKIEKLDWLITLKNGKSPRYFYAKTKKDAVAHFAGQKGTVQVFKLSHEFKDAWVNK